jgi:type II secretory ATPase GspE/PulE/Tfp pilus assembly ATPase PilB-like protein
MTPEQWLRPLYESLTRLLGERLREHFAGQEAPPEDPVAFFDALLQDAVRERATDIHLEPQSDGIRVRFRVDGVLLDTRLLDRAFGAQLIRHIKAMIGVDPIPLFEPHHAAHPLMIGDREMDLRLAASPCVYGEKLVLRLLNPAQVVKRLEDLGLSGSQEQTIRYWLEHVEGMFLAAGPVGSGKTTTLYALLHELRLAERSVVTIEDPVEYRIDGITQIEVDPKHHLDFLSGLSTALRLDPDYLLLGEIRTPESARAANRAAAVGHIMLSTLHARNAPGVVTALRNWGLTDYDIASTLEVVVAQRLVRRLCEACKQSVRPEEALLRLYREYGLPEPERVWKAQGCPECNGIAYRGRVGIFEVWRLDDEDKKRIADHIDEPRLIDHLRAKGHRGLVEDALEKVAAGFTDPREALRQVGAELERRG